MFGDLFNEGEVQGSQEAYSTNLQPPCPPRPRSECGLSGIDNQGATCYLNSLLQTLLLTPEFREKLFSLTVADLGSLENKEIPGAKVRVIPLELQRLFVKLLLSNQQSVSTSDLTNSFGWTNQEAFQQHDVQELNRILFNAIEESLVGTAGQNIIRELYHGTIVNQIICSKCKRISEREEDFQDLTVAVAGMSGLEDVLRQCYCHTEKMEGRNQYKCETCNTYTDATKGAKLRKLPPILSMSLLRFSFDFVKMSRYKENGRFTFPMELDMTSYSEKNEEEQDDLRYELFSVVVHRGSAFGGHYFAYIKDIDDLGTWTSPEEDKKQTKADIKSTGLDIIECQSPIDLIENILGGVDHNSMSIDRLCGEISKVTGVSWNKRFRKAHGPLYKFLTSCSSFEYNPDSNWVSLSSVRPATTVNENVRTDDENCVKEHGKVADKEKSSEQYVSFGANWFCFNDSVVSPIHARDIEKQFSGKESAYMLFYRRKSLVRPIPAHKASSYKIPDNLIKEVEECNTLLDIQRLEYDLMVNNITVEVGVSPHFVYSNVLRIRQDIPEEVALLKVQIDKRKTVGELKCEIFKMLSEGDRDANVVSIMKPNCGGYHLYDELKDESSVLQDLSFSSSTKLFLWDGIQVDGIELNIGERCEPIQVTLKDVDMYFMATFVINKDKTITDLYSRVTEIVDFKTFDLFQVDSGSESVLLSQKNDETLASAGLKDGDVLVVVMSSSNNSNANISSTPEVQKTKTNTEPQWSLTLINRLAGNDLPHTCMTYQLKASASEMVRDLKLRVLQCVPTSGGISSENVVLREDHPHHGLQPPLREALSLADTGLCDRSCLVIEHGRPPLDSEMTISINKVVCGKLVSRREFLVDRGLTVLGLLQAACKLMDCDGTQWYLSKTDIYGDAGEALDDSSVALFDVFINDGDTLMLQQGTLLKKDQVSVQVWLVSESVVESVGQGHGQSVDNTSVGDRQGEADRVMLELASKLSMTDNVPTQDLNPLNKGLYPNVEPLFDNSWIVQKAMGIEELKQALMSTDRCQTLMIPTCGFMRLRVLEGNRLKAVLRNNSQALRHTNLKESLNLAVQILRFEEQLGVHELLLMVAQKIGGTRIYLPPQEFVWKTSAGLGAADLKRVICQQMNLPSHDVLLAKYCPDTFTWIVLKDQPQKTNKTKNRKKGSSMKSNLRQAPFYIQDGDLIGIKILSEDKGYLEPNDFSTQEDIEKRQLLQHIAEEKKKARDERKRQQSDGFPTIRRPEASLTIKVDNFS